ncbi:FAD-dependent oxidoreductase [Enterovibrio norvegicus]|uniref:FAD-dependent oxidoreductase n=1 Tax=Enterovibrio norvegicus TaxID=188144 RepID=UPI0010BE5245|nr:FAD-dependent oxidoreductase [Enterovibrio norvegicus]TKF34809.1 FAD-dependent oxidoreductase [Enterovibrio norvegicus]
MMKDGSYRIQDYILRDTIVSAIEGAKVAETGLPFKVGIVGGGVAGATAALKLAGLGVETLVFESSESLVSGPPICHLHAGGNLYREISEAQCIALLEQSIATVRAYPHSVNRRPTVIAIPTSDPGEPDAILHRLNVLTAHYREMIESDADNAVLGSPDEYFTLYSKEDMLRLACGDLPDDPTTPDEWMVPVAKYMSLEQFKYPLVVVQEYGLSVFRLAATAALGLEGVPNCTLNLKHRVTHVEEAAQGWSITTHNPAGETHTHHVDFLINACGFRTGALDDLAQRPRERWVEYKAAYLAHWPSQPGIWPEVIVHGARGTPQGMAQLTPYPQGFIQLHGMTKDITLFDGGLVNAGQRSAQPMLPQCMIDKVDTGWEWEHVRVRTERAIGHFSQWLPAFENAEVGGIPLCGAQQIPGDDPSLRAADASFDGERYARIELVKASSALQATDRILAHCESKGWITLPDGWQKPSLALTASLHRDAIVEKAKEIATLRNYPEALAIPLPDRN